MPSLAFVCAFADHSLVGFVNLAWDGGIHAFLFDTTVHPNFQRQGIGRQLVKQAMDVAQERGMEWLHVDCDPRPRGFYQGCGFESTDAGLYPGANCSRERYSGYSRIRGTVLIDVLCFRHALCSPP